MYYFVTKKLSDLKDVKLYKLFSTKFLVFDKK